MQSRCPLVEKRSILSMETTIFKVGIATVVKVPELELNDFTLSQLLPALDPKVVEKHPDWIDCRTYDIKNRSCSPQRPHVGNQTFGQGNPHRHGSGKRQGPARPEGA
jgi:hypothetical protein